MGDIPTIRNVLLYLFPVFLLIDCNHNYNDYYKIVNTNKTIGINEIYEAKIYLLKKDEINTEFTPIFYIVYKQDTSYLPYDEKNFCATYRGTGSERGTKTWHCTFKYYTNKGKNVKVEFSDFYIVR